MADQSARLGYQTAILLAALGLLAVTKAGACTSAAWEATATSQKAPLIWKNRDTDSVVSRMVFVDEKPYKFVGLVDDTAASGRMVYAGLNERGFAIFNTVAYNLPSIASEVHDLEGVIMADALRTSTSVADFEHYLAANIGPDLGAQTNFVVFDATGEVFIYEVHNHGFEKFSVRDANNKRMINTNFSRSGAAGKGAGYLRYDRATKLVEDLGASVDVASIYNRLARDFGHSLVSAPSFEDLARRDPATPLWYASVDTIDREITRSALVFQGRRPGDQGVLATMWVMLGEPLTSLAVPVWVEAQAVPAALSQGKVVSLLTQSLRLRRALRPLDGVEKDKYMDLSLLENSKKSGIFRTLREAQEDIVKRTDNFLKSHHTSLELAKFQSALAEEATLMLKRLADAIPTPEGRPSGTTDAERLQSGKPARE